MVSIIAPLKNYEKPATFQKIKLHYRYYPVNFTKVLGTVISQNSYRRLPLIINIIVHNIINSNITK